MGFDDITKIKRHPERGSYDKDQLLDILRNGFACQVSFQMAGQPFVIPMTYYNNSEFIYIHGSNAARIINHLRERNPVAISVLELNGLVLAKRLADNSLNYRSAVIFGKPVEITDKEEKLSFFKEWINNLVPGRAENTILPSDEDLRGVAVFKVSLEQFSIKVRTGGATEVKGRPDLWSGVIPFSIEFHNPEFASDSITPEYVQRFIDRRNGKIQ
jgi:nitroimidazol reductase NimA-like FMN-containing flavoprotein (pyridoxamine 5'-phosphate oxidase superfamily)